MGEPEVVDVETVNVGHLMGYVDGEREEGNRAYKAGKHSEALVAWKRGLDAIAQADGLPMAVADVEVVLRARSVLHSNRGQALMSLQFWRRAIKDLTEALQVDPLNAKALWRRYKCHRALRSWDLAEADLAALLADKLQAAAGPQLLSAGVTPEQLTEAQREVKQLKEAADAEAEATFDDRLEEAAARGLTELRERFEEVTLRNGLRGNKELAAEIAEMLTRPGGVTAQFVAAVYCIEEEDAEVLLDWIRKASAISDELHGVV
uniref:Uncharacterized protein n=1 Tax=Haptolina ericina TaxID=156174 RepID=A0A7S3B1U4_9EUKA